MENLDKTNNRQRKDFEDFIHAIGSEIEQAQVKLISAANSQMLLHYWKMGNFIQYYQNQLGWGAKVIQQISHSLRSLFPDKKGYSPRNLQYMCQFSRMYPLEVMEKFLWANKQLGTPTVEKVLSTTKALNEYNVLPDPTKLTLLNKGKDTAITQQAVAQIEQLFLSSCISRINWAGHVILMNHDLPQGIRYWYMQEVIPNAPSCRKATERKYFL